MQQTVPSPKESAKNHLKYTFTYVILILITAFIFAFPIKWLWNWLMPGLFGTPEISAIEGWGLSFLSSLLIKPNLTIAEPKKPEQK